MSSRGGFFSLNRLLGRKNKNDKNQNLTKSSAQTLTRSTTNLEIIGPQNQIKPLTTVQNAPFEQTFRITVSLPLGQLYVARIGAKTKLNELLDMISTNKLLDPNKFEFMHPTDGKQIYDLGLTIGEVGLNEIKLVPKNRSNAIEKNPAIKYRIHQQNEIRQAIRPHTMSSVSPYSSTNSLNSSDSSGIVANQRTSTGPQIPAAPNRKKRAAPRPPSQNSIPENGEKIEIVTKPHSNTQQMVPVANNEQQSADFKKPLNRQDFHVSSPNLSTNNSTPTLQLYSSNGSSGNTSISSSFNRKQDEVNYKKHLNRPLSMQFNGSTVDDLRPSSASTNSNSSRNHSRTSSETSDITKDGHLPEPAQRKKLPMSKKKAPTPPPRTISTMPIGNSKMVLQNLNEEQIETEQMNECDEFEVSSNHSSVQTPISSPDSPVSDVVQKSNHAPNVSKVMLNVVVESSATVQKEPIAISQSTTFNGNSNNKNNKKINGNSEQSPVIEKPTIAIVENPNISKTQIVYEKMIDTTNEVNTLTVPVSKTKKTSVVSLNMEQNEVFIIPPIETNGNSFGTNTSTCTSTTTSSIDTENISEQINEIINEAVDVHERKLNEDISQQIDEIIQQAEVEINENQLNAVNVLKSKQNGIVSHEINNNNIENGCTAEDLEVSTVWNAKKEMSKVNSNGHGHSQDHSHANGNGNAKSIDDFSTGESTPESLEHPIKPILNEAQTFDFINEYSDHSLPTSTASTTNTLETPSTGPESIITSDIEDGYKGNEYDKQRKLELNREEFIESQFGFLSEHLDAKTSLESINTDDTPFETIEKHDVISSTFIDCNKSSSTSTPDSDKVDVINELTQIINCNRLDTFIKPCNGSDDDKSDISKRSSLKNFHIGAYTHGNHENIKTAKISSNEQPPQNGQNGNGNDYRDEWEREREYEREEMENKQPKITSVIPKQVNRSMSFHSTFPLIVESNANEQNCGIHLSLAPRSTSYVSLVSIQKQENRNEFLPTENGLKKAPHKSSSELSIADIPSLQSIEIMKSILSTTLNFDRMSSGEKVTKKETKPIPKLDEQIEVTDIVEPEKKVPEIEKVEKFQTVDKVENKSQVEEVKAKPAIKVKTWKYEGPPSINLSTWGERPKSEVFIKSDNDYIFGGVSNKMAALQKRFSGAQDDKASLNGDSDRRCDSETCKLPIVRGVEYKKNIKSVNNSNTSSDSGNSTRSSNRVNDSTDSVEEVAIRPSYEISRIVPEKSFSEKSSNAYKSMTLNRFSTPITATTTINPKPVPPTKPIHSTNSLQRNRSFTQINGFPTSNTNGSASAVRQNGGQNVDSEKPAFSQFTLRKTGLKEKILDEKTSNGNEKEMEKMKVEHVINNNGAVNTNEIIVKPKLNPIPTAPKPPPMLKSTILKKSISVPARTSAEPRDELLDAIRSFNRDTLKRNRLI